MKHTVEIDAVDIPTMYSMNLDEYKNYIENELLWVRRPPAFSSGAVWSPGLD